MNMMSLFVNLYYFFRKADSNHNSGSGGGEGGGGCPPLGGSTSSRGVSIDIDMTLMEQTTNHTTITTTTTTEFTTIQQNGGGKHVTLIQNGAKHKDDIINICPVQNGGKHKDDIINGSIVDNGDNGHVTKQVSLPEAGPSRPTTLDLNTRRYLTTEIYRDKTIANKLMYIPNDDTQDYPFCRLQL